MCGSETFHQWSLLHNTMIHDFCLGWVPQRACGLRVSKQNTKISSFMFIYLFFQEKEKIVLYIPTGEDLDKKIKNIGLCEALVKFTQ